jgi:hypothetical protein
MKASPIIMSAESVLAILAGRKSQSRRVVTPGTSTLGSSTWDALDFSDPCNFVDRGSVANPFCPVPETQYLHVWTLDKSSARETCHRVYPRIEAGTRLWVREGHGWCRFCGSLVYRADNRKLGTCDDGACRPRWESPIFIPRHLSRIALEVTSVHVQRVQAITDEDAIAEGVKTMLGPEGEYPSGHPRADYADAWDKRNAHRSGCSWESNCYVWVYDFKRFT